MSEHTDRFRDMMQKSFFGDAGMMDEKEKVSTANFGNMAEPVFAVCTAAYILSDHGVVIVNQVKDILLNSLRKTDDEGVYDLTGSKSIFDFDAQKDIQTKELERQNQQAEKMKFMKKINDFIAKNYKNVNLSFDSERAKYRKFKLTIDGEQIFALALVVPPRIKGSTQKDAIKKFAHTLDDYFPGLIGNDDGSPIKVEFGKQGPVYVGFKFKKMSDTSDMQRFDDLKEENYLELDMSKTKVNDVPKLMISVNHNVIPTIQRILQSGSGAKYEELMNMIETIAVYLRNGDNEISNIRNIYHGNKKKKTPSNLIVRIMGREGQTGDGKGVIKGDIEIRINDADGKVVYATKSLKYGHDVVHKFTSADALIDGMNDVFEIAELNSGNIILKEWNDIIKTNKSVERIIGLPGGKKYGLCRLLQNMSPSNKAKMLFAFLERFAHGAESSSIIRIDKDGNEAHAIPSLIAHYLSYQDKKVIIEPGTDYSTSTYIQMQIVDNKDVYGILKIKEQIIMDAELKNFVKKVEAVFTQPKTDMWQLILYHNYMAFIAAKYSKTKNLLRTYRNRADDYASHAIDISRKFKHASLPVVDDIVSDVSADNFKKSNIMKFMNNDIESLDPKVINAYISAMVKKTLELYKIVKTFEVTDIA